MQIRHIRDEADVRGLVRVHGLAWQEAYDDLLPAEFLERVPVDPDDEVIGELQEGLRENHEGILIAVEDGTILGFVDVRWGDAETKEFVREGEADLKAIYVHPDHWGRGVGTELLDAGLALLPEAVDTVRLEMFADNDVALPFYEARGFERTGTGEYEIEDTAYPTYIYTRRL